ncbi:hypothetical protein HDE_06755 [Halotydeus destructor]|nr:hypothetical protein HDE_06755 [Halotydeus destructor]
MRICAMKRTTCVRDEGLVPDTDQQTFEMLLPIAIHGHYHKARASMFAYTQSTNRMQFSGGKLTQVDIEKVIPTYVSINKYLIDFVEYNYKDVGYTIKHKQTLERVGRRSKFIFQNIISSQITQK